VQHSFDVLLFHLILFFFKTIIIQRTSLPFQPHFSLSPSVPSFLDDCCFFLCFSVFFFIFNDLFVSHDEMMKFKPNHKKKEQNS